MSDPIKFLLVDDVEENLLALEVLLRRPGLQIFMAGSGREALELLLAHDFALAFLDVQMPEMDGFELAELMRGAQRSKHVPIIFVTATPRQTHRMFKGYESGAVDVLFKPIDPLILQHKANIFFELYRQRQLLASELQERGRLVAEVQRTLHLNETFAAALGHDLRNPLHAIVTGASLLLEQSSDAQTKKIAGRILSSGSRMARLLDQLLDLARARLAGGIPMTPAPMNVAAVIDRIVAEHRQAHPRRTLQFDSQGDPNGFGDEARFGQVVSNLIGNAIQHGASETDVTVRLDGRRSEALVVTVSNAGVIDPSVLQEIFEPFRSGALDRERTGNLGLGLYITQQIVHSHGGTIEVRSTPLDGTTFEVVLPRTNPEDRVAEPT
jgi:signal transduction histidine kinase